MLELLEDEARPRQKPKMEVLLVKSPEVGGYGERGQGKRDGFCECCASRSWQLIAACNEHVLVCSAVVVAVLPHCLPLLATYRCRRSSCSVSAV